MHIHDIFSSTIRNFSHIKLREFYFVYVPTWFFGKENEMPADKDSAYFQKHFIALGTKTGQVANKRKDVKLGNL